MILSALILAASVGQAQSWAPDPSAIVARARAQRLADASALAAALKTPQGEAAVRGAFDGALAQAMVLRFGEPVMRIAGDAWPQASIDRAALVPETAGQAWLVGGRLVLAPAGEPSLSLMRDLAKSPEDRSEAARLYARDPTISERLDGEGNGHMLKLWLANSLSVTLPAAKTKVILGRIVLSVLETGCERYPFDQPSGPPAGGRAAGLWHLHPPRVVAGDWFDGDVPGSGDGGPTPSDSDLQLGASAGRNLTLVFRKDGFDAYDASGKAAALLASYRSPSWAAHFAPALARLTAP